MAAARAGIAVATPEQEAAFGSQSCEAIWRYLDLFEDTESPRNFHIWSLIGTVAALLGKNTRLVNGPNLTVNPNLFIVLLGPPATRKSTAVNLAAGLVKNTSLNFGPTDTGGQRQGLMSALTGLHRDEGKWYRQRDLIHPIHESLTRPRAPNDMFLVAPELGRLFGATNREMSDFMLDLFDSADIDYQTKAGETKLSRSLVTLLGATTPSSFASMIPDNAGTHGILSRMIFVYEDKLYKIVPLPPDPTEEWEDKRAAFRKTLRWIDGNRRTFHLDPMARDAYERLYQYRPLTEDPRLESYTGRRAELMLKVGMSLAALRLDNTVIESDLLVAHELLILIEPRMHRALESFGKNKAYQGRILMVQYLRNKDSGMATAQELTAIAAAELKPNEAKDAITAMITNGELILYGQHLMLGTAANALKTQKRTK